MRAVIYARYSSDNQTEASIEGQLRECMEYATYNDIQIIGNYIDRAYSAKTDNRPEFQRMIKDSYKHAFDCIIVWKLDRRQRKLCANEDMLVYSVYFAYGYVYENLYEYGCLV